MKNVLDNEGELSIVRSRKNADSGYWDYAKGFSYTAAGAVGSMQLGNGRWESTVFNSRLQPTQIALGTVQSGTDKLKLNFDYGTATNNGNVLSQTITVPTENRDNQTYAAFTAVQTYSYDSLNRIKDAKEMIGAAEQWKQTFDYDRYGNRRFDANNTTTLAPGCQTAVCNPTIDPATNKLVGYSFDNAGNTKIDAENRQFIHDGENKQVEVKDQNGASIGKYYNGDGQRVKKISATESTVFVYNASGQLVGEYATQITQPQDAKASYLTTDHLGSPRITTDANGQVISRRDFQPFGEEIARAGYGTDDVRQKFTTYERDEETELDYAKARMHSFNHGRFTSPDPIMMARERLPDPQSVNLFVYARNNPLKYIDPTGEKFKGKDKKEVTFEIKDGQIAITSDNATEDIVRLVGLINSSGSSTALAQFSRLNAHKTMVNFAFAGKDPAGISGALHQPHGTRPDGSSGPLEFDFQTQTFKGEADFIPDGNGNEVYAEATITIYEGMYTTGSEGESVEDQMVATFGHEAEHDLDLRQVQETKNKTYRDSVYHPRTPDGRDWAEGSPNWIARKIGKEIREFRQIQQLNNRQRSCPSGHMCF